MKKIFCALGTLFFLFVLFLSVLEVKDRVNLYSNKVTTNGRVIFSEYIDNSDSCESIIEYRDETGLRYELSTSVGYKLWSEVAIMYEKGNPTNAFTADFYGSWFILIFKFFFIFIFLHVFVIELIKKKPD